MSPAVAVSDRIGDYASASHGIIFEVICPPKLLVEAGIILVIWGTVD